MVVGIGASVSTTIGGLLIQHLGFRASFLGLSLIASLAFTLLWKALPETLSMTSAESSGQAAPSEISSMPIQANSSGATLSGDPRGTI